MVHSWELDLKALKEYIDSKEEHKGKETNLMLSISQSLRISQLEVASQSISTFLKNYPDKKRF